MRALIVSLLVLLAVPAAAAERAQVRLADVLISYDPAHWRVSSEAVPPTLLFSGLKLGRTFFIFICIAKPPVCHGEPMLFASAGPASEIPEKERERGLVLDLLGADGGRKRPLWGKSNGWRDRGGLVLFGRKSFSGCRARTPVTLSAFGEHEGVAYRFSSGFASGCGGVWGVPDEMFEELLAGVSLAEPIIPNDKARQ